MALRGRAPGRRRQGHGGRAGRRRGADHGRGRHGARDVRRAEAADTLPADGDAARAWAGAPGFGFARVMVGASGERMVPHYAAVDVASDNRLMPQTAFTTEHRFAATCAEPTVSAVLVHRALPLALARARGLALTESRMVAASRGPLPPLVAPPDLDPAAEVVRVALRAAPMTLTVDGEPVAALAYNGQVPGPTIRARLGQRLVVDFVNDLDTPTTVHWHGLRVPYAMDGAAWQGDAIPPGGRFTFDLPLTQAGTFWYHPHFDTERQVDLGLFGTLVVEDAADPPADQDVALVFDTWGEAAPTGGGHAHAHAATDDRKRQWRVNGALTPILTARGGTVVRARFINASNTGYLALRWPDLALIATDQGLLPEGRLHPEHLLLAPGDRAEAEWRIGERGFDLVAEPYSLHGGALRGEAAVVASVAVVAPAPAPAGLAWPFPAALPAPYDGPSDVVWVLQGSGHVDRWRISGEAFPDITPAALTLGQPAVIEVRNLSPTDHPFHLHGHRFEVLDIDGEPPPARLIEDTVNVGLYQTVHLALVADNPGDWMAHCHILPHAHGMMTVLRVPGP